jgi:hypothetical protein
MQALIIKDLYDSEKSYKNLLDQLEGFEIFEITSIRYFEDIKCKMNQDLPCLFFPNIFVRFPNHLSIYNFHKKNDFSGISIKDQIVSFLPSKTKLNDRKNYILCPGNIFKLSNIDFYNYKDNYKEEDIPTVFMLTYGRNDYLRLALNSLVFSLEGNCNIKIGLNCDDSYSEKLLREYQDKYNFIEVLKFDSNSYISGFNVLYQIFKPDRFIIFEDDFILPEAFKKYYPNWPRQFIDRLDYFDTVSMGATLDNAPFNWALERNIKNDYVQGDWEIIGEFNNKFLMGQLFSIKSDLFLKIIKKYKMVDFSNNTKKYLTPTDKEIYKESTRISSPSLRGYHIGWNEGQDGLKKNYDKYQNPKDSYTVESLKNFKKYFIKLEDILNY